jgi:hypothetical protein
MLLATGRAVGRPERIAEPWAEPNRNSDSRYGPIWLSVTLPVASMTIVIGLSPFIAFAVTPSGVETYPPAIWL